MIIRDFDGPIAWRESGAGEPVVFLHGLGGSRTAWDLQLADLGDTWRCIAWDAPGYGASAPLTGRLTFAALAAAVVELLDAAAVERAHLVGLSMGGMIALHAALWAPARVGRLVLADTSAAFGADGTDPDEWRSSRVQRLDRGESVADIAPDVIAAVAAPGFAGPARDLAVAAHQRIDDWTYRQAVDCIATHDVVDRLGAITSPALVLVGELDRVTPPEYAVALAAGLPDARLEVLPGAGHLTPCEQPERFNELTRGFLVESATTLGSRADSSAGESAERGGR